MATFTAPETATGETLTFILTVSDGKVDDQRHGELVVHPVNRAPAVTAAAVVVDERSTATLAATAADRGRRQPDLRLDAGVRYPRSRSRALTPRRPPSPRAR